MSAVKIVATVLMTSPADKRLGRVLLRLAHLDQKRPSVRKIPTSGDHVLAEVVGTTRSRVNFFMNRFRRRGYISYNGEIDDFGPSSHHRRAPLTGVRVIALDTAYPRPQVSTSLSPIHSRSQATIPVPETEIIRLVAAQETLSAARRHGLPVLPVGVYQRLPCSIRS